MSIEITDVRLKAMHKVFSNQLDMLRRMSDENNTKFRAIRNFQLQIEKIEKAQKTLNEAQFMYDNWGQFDVTAQSSVVPEAMSEKVIIDAVADVLVSRKWIVADMDTSFMNAARKNELMCIANGIAVALSKAFPNQFNASEFLGIVRGQKS